MKLFFLFFLLSKVLTETIPFKIGETLYYKASFANLKAASAELKVIKKDTISSTKVYHVQFFAKTEGLTDYLFPINDKIDLWLDEQSLLPIKIQKKIEEGRYKNISNIDLYQNSGYAISNNDTFEIEYGTHSPYSLFYFFRKKNFSRKKEEIINTIQGKEIIQLKLKVDYNITTKVPAGNFNCFRVLPVRLDNKKFKNKAEMSILYSSDNNRYPIKIWLNLKYGSLELELEKIIN